MKQFIRIKRLVHSIRTSVWILLTAFLCNSNAYAQFDGGVEDLPVIQVIGTANGGSLALNQGAWVSNTFVPNGFEQSKKIINIVRLSLFEETNLYLPADFTATLDVLIEYGPNSTNTYSYPHTFSVSYSKAEGTKYNAKNYFSFEGAEFVKITIVNPVNPGSAGGVDLKNVLLLENEMKVTRYYNLYPGITPTFFPGPTSVSNTVDRLNVSWTLPAHTGHNATQLEWTWLEDELAPPGGPNIDELFRDNATRVDLPHNLNTYNIPLFYDGIGKLYYRVRPVNIKANGSRQDGIWTTPNWGTGICAFSGHNNALNWQVRTSFAEEGKMKSVMEYYDGSLRSRQTVTKENVNNTTITAETFYDYEGRPAIQILPVPGITGVDNIIKYRENLNRFNGQAENSNPAAIFDLEPINPPVSSFTEPMLTSTGASRYYSPQNPEINDGPNKHIPDAEGYPYTVTRYTPDATGRIMAQGGVGPAHKMSSGRETKYYYGSPSQEELDGLFGTEVGNKTHYFKNMVKDANGQMSVTYTDMHGRTIATALAGASPDNLIGINNAQHYPNQQGTPMTRNLLDNATNIVKGNSIESINSILVPAQTDYTFKYKLTPESLNLASCTTGVTICYECLYDLEISITDETGEQAPFVYTYKNLTVSGDVDDNCSTHNPFVAVCPSCPAPVNNEITIVRGLAPGSYSVRKTLTISESSLQKYKDLYMQVGKGICKTEQQIIDSVYNVLLSITNCNSPTVPGCQECLTQLGDLQTFQTDYLATVGNPSPVPPTLLAEITTAYNAALQNCNRICNTSSQNLSSRRQLMLADMMPYGGQYATDGPIDPVAGTSMYNKYNIFSTAFGGQPFYKNPRNESLAPDYYRNNIGEVDEQIHPGGSGYTVLNNTTPEQFTNQFVNYWAKSLLSYHPEFPRLVYAETNIGSNIYNWINSFSSTSTYAQAELPANQYIMTSNATLIDPLYATVPSLKPNMVTWITTNYANSNISMWMMARGSVKCKNYTDPGQQIACLNVWYNGEKVPPFFDINSADEKNEMWRAFRGLYASARENQLNSYIAQQRPLADDATLIAQKYKLRFGTNNQTVSQYGGVWYPLNIGDPPPAGLPPVNLNQTYASRCSSYINQWRTSLLQCTAIATHGQKEQILTEIVNGMLAVCIGGSDAANPYGSSTVAPGSPVTPGSFEAVITAVLSNPAYNINQRDNYFCNPYVIEFPKPYGKGPNLASAITTTVDSCACANFSLLKSAAIAAGYNPVTFTSLNTYLQVNNMQPITQVLFDALQGCSGYQVWVCDEEAPVTVSCYDPEPCITQCYFRQANKDSVMIESQPTSCADWNFLIACLYDMSYPPDPPMNMQPWCQESFVNLYNAYYDPDLSWQQIAANYQAMCGQPLNVCIPCTTTVMCPTQNCHWEFAPYHLSSPQPLPDYLKCGGWPPASKCMTCAEMVDLTNEFKPKFDNPINSGPLFTASNLTPDQIQQNILYSRFLNFRTGMQFSWMQYAQASAAANCNPYGGGGAVDLEVTTRTGNTPAQYIASNSITFLPDFESGVNDLFETILQPGGGPGGPQTVICRDTKPLNDSTGFFVLDTLCHQTHTLSISIGQNVYQQQILAIQANFERQYQEKCLAAKNLETFTVYYASPEYHYTLYYYDRAGSLVKTVPPKGVRPDFNPDFLLQVKNARANEQFLSRPHELVTQYRYNSLGGVVAQNSPDLNTSHFWYDRIGRLAISQNAQQYLENKYSYTKYDLIGRIIETGQKSQNVSMSQLISQDETELSNWLNIQGGAKEQINITGYDIEFEPNRQPYIHQQNLRNRVSFTAFRNSTNEPQPPPYYCGTLYTYDIHGNVDTLLQDYSGVTEMSSTGNTFKRITYKYDLLSGKVNKVSYQQGEWDAFHQRYKYDAETRVIEAWTSRDNIQWERDASYQYFKHGPLNRAVLGHLNIQGVDYTYTLQGWLKGINGSNSPTGENGMFDTGEDALTGGINSKVAKDAFGLAMYYFDDGVHTDYKRISVGNPFFAVPNNPNFKSLYNGNVAAMANNIGYFSNKTNPTYIELPLFYNYRYDQLHRLRSNDVFWGLNYQGSYANQWTPYALNDYKEQALYDPNGNILSYLRNGSPSVPGKSQEMDDLVYNYIPNKNQLRQISDNPAYSGNYSEDIDHHSNTNNYSYDATGNLKSDLAEGISNINWTVYGKISTVIKNGALLSYTYDADGNRITKTYNGRTTIYVRNSNGNIVSIYEKQSGQEIEQNEVLIYGNSRIGILNKNTIAPSSVVLSGQYGTANIRSFTRGEKEFEIGNHLNTIQVIVSDKKLQRGVTTVNFYEADVISANDYYPFGMSMPGRSSSNSYRYGYNGREKENEISTATYDFHARMYDARISRWFSPDKVIKPDASPFEYCTNNPVNYFDPDGRDEIHFYFITSKKNVTTKGFYQSNWPNAGGRYQPPTTFEQTVGKTTATYVIIKASGPDKFYHHDVTINNTTSKISDKVTQFFPGVNKSRSGLTSESFFFINRKDRDFATLMKYTNGNSDLQNYFNDRWSNTKSTASQYDKDTYLSMFFQRDAYNVCRAVSHYGQLAAVVAGTIATAGELALGLRTVLSGSRGLAITGNSNLAIVPYKPINNGFLGATERKFLMPGEEISRYGSTGGKFLSPAGTPMEMRALMPGTNTSVLNTYRVMKPFEVEAGAIAPAFGQLGLGTQYISPVTVQILLKRGFLQVVK